VRHPDWRFKQVYPYLLGALCSVVSKTMANYSAHGHEHADNRMQNFHGWARPAEGPLGYKPGDFMKAYTANQQELRYLALEFSPTIITLIDWKRGHKHGNAKYPGHTADWTGTHQELLGRL
jgi:hypothetical protein